jgi:hypothetical protein
LISLIFIVVDLFSTFLSFLFVRTNSLHTPSSMLLKYLHGKFFFPLIELFPPIIYFNSSGVIVSFLIHIFPPFFSRGC